MASKFDQLVADAIAHHKAGRLDQAEAAYRDALGIVSRPSRRSRTISAWLPRPRASIAPPSAILTTRSRPSRNMRPRITTAPSAQQALGQSREAIQSFARVCAIEPGALRRPSRARISVACGRRPRPRARSFRAHLRAQARRGPDRHRGQELDRGDARQAPARRRAVSLSGGAPPRPSALRGAGAELRGGGERRSGTSRAALRRAARHARRGLQHRDPYLRRAGACRAARSATGRTATR